ncbi:MAG: haloalkane dehalogenase [Acidimicrobiia bacterium]
MYEALRTPDERFEDLPDFSFPPRYVEWEGLRLHYLDEGDGRPVVLFHGEPTWSFLYRKVMVPLLDAGYRAIAPDYPGFGRSDKPTDPAFYTYDRHTEAMAAILAELSLEGATAVVQDWGGPIGLRLTVDHPEWFGRLSILNTGLFGGGKPSEGFMTWRRFVERTEDLPIGVIMQRSMIQEWPDQVIAAYEAPFPDVTYKMGAHRFPLIVPLAEDDPGADTMRRVRENLGQWEAPTQVLFSTGDPVFSTRTGARFVDRIPGATELETVDEAGHFLQEDQGEEVGRRIAAFLRRTD